MKIAVPSSCFSIILLLLAIPSTLTLAQTPPSEKIVILTEDIAPYQFVNQQGNIDGYCAEVIEALLAQLDNRQDKIQVMSWARAYDIASRRPNTLIFSMARTPERESSFHWIGKLLDERLYLWGLKEHFVEPIDNMQQLTQYRVATTRGSYAQPFLIEQGFDNLHLSTREDSVLFMLYDKRIDMLISTKLAVQSRVKKLALDYSKLTQVLRIDELDSELYIAFSKGTALNTVQRYRDAYQKLAQNGQLARIKAKWQIN